MKFKFNIKIDEDLGTIYERPIFNVEGGFETEDLEEFLTVIPKDMKKRIEEYIKIKGG